MIQYHCTAGGIGCCFRSRKIEKIKNGMIGISLIIFTEMVKFLNDFHGVDIGEFTAPPIYKIMW